VLVNTEKSMLPKVSVDATQHSAIWRNIVLRFCTRMAICAPLKHAGVQDSLIALHRAIVWRKPRQPACVSPDFFCIAVVR
jgi:hypothetical protein